MSVRIEFRTPPATRTVSRDIMQDIADNHLHGNIAVIVDGQIKHAYAAFRKQWTVLLRVAERTRASTLDHHNRELAQAKYAKMMQLQGSVWLEHANKPDAIFFTTVAELLLRPQSYRVLYVTHPVDSLALRKLTSKMPDNGVVICYSPYELLTSTAKHPWRANV